MSAPTRPRRTVLPVFALLAALASAAAHAEPQVLIDADFGAEQQQAAPAGKAGGRVTGSLPVMWWDNSDWAPVTVDYKPVREGERGFLRVDVTRIDSGFAQFARDVPAVAEDALFRLSFTARGRGGAAAMQVGLRDRGAPYQFAWRVQQRLADGWRDYAYEFRLHPRDKPLSLFIVVGDVQVVDLARLKLVRLTREGLIAEAKRRHPDGGPSNLLGASRFLVGLPAGWWLGRDYSDWDDVKLTTSSNVLEIDAHGGFSLHSAPFVVPWAFEPHTASLSLAAGRGKGKLSVLADGRTIAEGAFEADGPPRWVHVPFDPVLLAASHALRVEGTGRFTVEGVMVRRGRHDGPAAAAADLPPGPEVGLGVRSGAAAEARVSFDDEPAEVEWAVSPSARGGASGTMGNTGAVLKAKVVNAYGEQAVLPDVRLDAGATRGTLRYDAFPNRPYGSARVEAWVESGGRPVGNVAELVVHRLRRPRYWGKDAPDSPFGVHTNSTTRHNRMAKAVGINWVRLHDAGTAYTGWNYLEPEPGKWSFRDAPLNRYRRQHLKVLGSFSTAPRWARVWQKSHVGYFDQYFQPKDLGAFANYVRAVTKRYGGPAGAIDAWDVWNEPWNPEWWAVRYDEAKGGREGYVTSDDPAGDFARLMKAAYDAAKAADPKATVLGVQTAADRGTGNLTGEQWTAGVVARGGLSSCDVLCYHQYAAGPMAYPDDAVEKGYRNATGPAAEAGQGPAGRRATGPASGPKPVWMTEGSAVGGVIGKGLYDRTFPADPAEDVADTADRQGRFVVALLGQGVRKVFLYSMHTHGGGSEWRVLVTEDGYLHPSAAAFSAMAWHLEDTRFARRIEVAEGVYAYLFEKAVRSVAVIAPRPGKATPWVPPAGVGATDLFGNPLKAGNPVPPALSYITSEGNAARLEAMLVGGKPTTAPVQ